MKTLHPPRFPTVWRLALLLAALVLVDPGLVGLRR